MSDFSIVLDETSLVANHGVVTGHLHVLANGHRFPDPLWNDFVVVILGWWCEALLACIQDPSHEAELRFMDGPYHLRVRPADRKYHIAVELCAGRQRHAQGTFVSTHADLCAEVLRASESVIKYCQLNKINNKDVDTLRRGAAALRAAASRLQIPV